MAQIQSLEDKEVKDYVQFDTSVQNTLMFQ